MTTVSFSLRRTGVFLQQFASFQGLLLIFLLFAGFSLKAGDIKYPVSAIPDHLKENANAVVRLHKEEFIVDSKSKAVEKVQLVVTIFNKSANSYAHMYVHYDDLSKVKNLKGYVYDARGQEIDKLKKKDIQDMSNFQSFSIFEDNRVQAARLEKFEYPYTVEWIYEKETENMMFYPVWIPQSSEKLAVENAELVVEMPAGMKLRYLESPLAPACQLNRQPDKSVYRWEVKNLKVVETEPLHPSIEEYIPIVYTAPDEFEVAGYTGSMSSWKSYGQWINLLNRTQNDLPPAAVKKVKELTQQLSTPEEKIKAVYDYLQANTRYVSIQLGIGGWQPFKTSFVYDKGYGDCKALSFYTKSLLETIGIPSHYTLIRAGSNKMDVREDFPISTFNHAILCVPNQQDTIWLECTSQTNPFGYLGDFTSDREAVIITPEGGKVVKTPAYKQEENLQNTRAHVYLSEGTSAEVQFSRTYEGLQFENHDLSFHINEGPDEQRKWIYEAVKITGTEIKDFSLSLDNKPVPVATLKAKMLIRNFTTPSGKRSFIALNMGNQLEYSYPLSKDRKKDFILETPFIDTDSLVYHLPSGIKVEYLPEAKELKTDFGEYSASARQEENKIIYTRVLKGNKGRFPAEKYNDYVKFMQEIIKADQAKVVLVAE